MSDSTGGMSDIEFFLTQTSFFGHSEYKDREAVALLCAGLRPDQSIEHFAERKRQRIFDRDRKLWGTRRLSNLDGLIQSGLWRPVGIEPVQYGALLQNAKARIRFLEGERSTKAEQKIAEERAKTLVGSKTAAQRDEERRAAELKAGFVKNSDEDLQHLFELGLSEDALAKSVNWRSLGPVLHISAAERIVRLLNARRHAARVESDCFFDNAALAPIYQRVEREVIDELNATAASGLDDFAALVKTVRRAAHPTRDVDKPRAQKRSRDPVHRDDPAIVPSTTSDSRVVKPARVVHTKDLIACRQCKKRVMIQFLDCGCPGLEWHVCSSCSQLCSATQRCRCV